jgi:hypothetical protein
MLGVKAYSGLEIKMAEKSGDHRKTEVLKHIQDPEQRANSENSDLISRCSFTRKKTLELKLWSYPTTF